MRKSLFFLSVLFLAGSFAGAADPNKEKETYLRKADKDLQEWNSKVERLEQRSKSAGSRTRDTVDQQVTDLRAKVAAAQGKLAELRSANNEKWSALRQKMDDALKDVRNAYRKTKSFFKKEEKS